MKAQSLTKKIGTMVRLQPVLRRRALAAILVTAGVRLALWALPFRTVKRLAGIDPWKWLPFAGASADDVAGAVCLASRYVPRATCLTQALTAQILLNRARLRHQLLIGVAGRTGFEAHAWIECEGRVLIGGSERHGSYATILTIEGLEQS